MEREGAAVTCDGRLFHRRAAATGNALSSRRTVDRRLYVKRIESYIYPFNINFGYFLLDGNYSGTILVYGTIHYLFSAKHTPVRVQVGPMYEQYMLVGKIRIFFTFLCHHVLQLKFCQMV